MLNKVLEIIEYDKVVINNIDITVLSQVINISKISEAIISNLADLLRIDKQLINVKGKSFDYLGVIGDGIASAVFLVFVAIDVNNTIYSELFNKPYEEFKFVAIDKGSLDIGIYDVSQEFYESGKEKVTKALETFETTEE